MNKMIIAAAGSGKTTYLVEEAFKIKDENVLITTFTETNRDEIIKKIIKKKKFVPKNIVVQTWFSFLLHHGVRPYQSILDDSLHKKKIGFYLITGRSGLRYRNSQGMPVYWGEKDFFKYYFTNDLKIYSDKISKFVFETNKKSKGEVIDRVSRIYKHIFIDEIQDLAGWDLEILKLLIESKSNILMVGDPRQAVYETNDSTKHQKYRDGKIIDYLKDNCKQNTYIIDTETLNVSHRNNASICEFSSKLYPSLKVVLPCTCVNCRTYKVTHEGIYLIRESELSSYIRTYKPQILRYSQAIYPELNFGISKGLTFERVLIYPTAKMKEYIKDGDLKKINSICAKLYVAITRAKYSVGIVYDFGAEEKFIAGIQRYSV